MNFDKFNSIIELYTVKFSRLSIRKIDKSLDEWRDLINDLDVPETYNIQAYLIKMLSMIKDLPEEDIEKRMRWLGFMQGVMWAIGMFSINELREHNRE